MYLCLNCCDTPQNIVSSMILFYRLYIHSFWAKKIDSNYEDCSTETLKNNFPSTNLQEVSNSIKVWEPLMHIRAWVKNSVIFWTNHGFLERKCYISHRNLPCASYTSSDVFPIFWPLEVSRIHVSLSGINKIEVFAESAHIDFTRPSTIHWGEGILI